MKAINSLITAFVFLITFASCDFYGNYYYFIENDLQEDTITVKTDIKGYRYPNEILDSVFLILPKEKKLIRNTPTGVSGKYEHPDDILSYYCELGEFQVFINNKKINKKFWERKYWQYTTAALKGSYLLRINEENIKDEE